MYQKPKEQAKAILKDHGHLRVTLAYLLPTAGLSLLVNFLMPDYYGAMMSMDGDAITNAITMNGGLGLFLHILIMFFGILMSFGYKQWALLVAQGQKPPLSCLIAGFGEASKVLWLSIMKFFCVYLWTMAMLIGLVFGFSLVFLLSSEAFMMLLIPLVLGIATVAVFWIQVRYSLVELQMADNMEKGAWDAMRQGVRRQRIAFEKIVKYYLSYWRWLLVYLATVFGYYLLNIALGAQGLSADMLDVDVALDLMATENALAYWISTAVDWIFMLKFMPVFYVGLAVVFEDIKGNENSLMDQYHKGLRREG